MSADENKLIDDLAKVIADNANPQPPKNQKSLLYKIIAITSITTLAAVLFFYSAGSLFSSPEHTGPWGEISSPTAGTITGAAVKVVGATKNIEPGQYVWLAVDKPDLGLCWPKVPGIAPNTGFSTVIDESGPREPYSLSLYAVTKTINDQWQNWLAEGKFGGLPMPPDNRLLDSVELILGG